MAFRGAHFSQTVPSLDPSLWGHWVNAKGRLRYEIINKQRANHGGVVKKDFIPVTNSGCAGFRRFVTNLPDTLCWWCKIYFVSFYSHRRIGCCSVCFDIVFARYNLIRSLEMYRTRRSVTAGSLNLKPTTHFHLIRLCLASSSSSPSVNQKHSSH